MANTITRQAGCWIAYQLKVNGHTQDTVAREANRSNRIVSQFLCGCKDSKPVRTALCKVLGYKSFDAILANMPRETEGGAA